MEEEVVEEYVPETAEAGPDPTIGTEAVQPTDAAPVAPEGNAYDFKEYDLKEYDVNELGGTYDYGAYDDLGTSGPAPTAMAYDDEIGQGKPAETDVSEASVSMTPTPPRRLQPAATANQCGCMSSGVSCGFVWRVLLG